MKEKNPRESRKPLEINESLEIQIMQILGNTLPAMLAHIAADIRDREDLIPPGEKFSNADLLRFLATQDLPRKTEKKILQEWKSGDEILLISFLTLTVVRGHLNTQNVESGFQEVRESDGKISDGAEEFLDLVKREHANIVGALLGLMDKSQQFGKRYTARDLKIWVDREESIIREARKLGSRIFPLTVEDYRVFDRILSENFQKQDRARLREIIDRAMRGAMIYPELNFIEVLEDRPNKKGDLVGNIQSLLRLYCIRQFVDEVIPIKEQ